MSLLYPTTCPSCDKVLQLEDGHVIVSCQRNLTPYKDKNQTTTVVGHTHGVGSFAMQIKLRDLGFPVSQLVVSALARQRAQNEILRTIRYTTPTGMSRERLFHYLQARDKTLTREDFDRSIEAFQSSFTETHTTLKAIAEKAKKPADE